MIPDAATVLERLRDSAEMAGVVIELAERWTRQDERHRTSVPREHDQGRMEGYVQAIGLMIGTTASETREMLRRGLLANQ